MPLDVKIIEKRDYVYVVELNGSLDTTTHQELQKDLQKVIDARAKVVIMDMAGVEYISSVGVGVIIWLKGEMDKRDVGFSMVNLKPPIKKVLDIMKIIPIVDILEDIEEADKFIDEIMSEESETK